jgi:hypothetical protein
VLAVPTRDSPLPGQWHGDPGAAALAGVGTCASGLACHTPWAGTINDDRLASADDLLQELKHLFEA